MNEEAMWRATSPLYQAFCREDEDMVDAEAQHDYEADRADDAWAEKGLN